MSRKDHQNEAHDDMSEAVRVAHEDAEKAAREIRKANPFTITNILIAVFLLVFTALFSLGLSMAHDFISKTEDGQQKTELTLQGHGIMLTNLQSDVIMLKNVANELRINCMTRDAVDDRIRLMTPPARASMSPKVPTSGFSIRDNP